ETARRISDRPVWVQGVGWCLDTAYWTNRDLCYPEYVEKAAWMAYKMAGVRESRKQVNIAEPLWQLRGEAGKRQVPGKPERGVAQAWGDLMQVGTVVVMGTKPV